MFFYRNVVEEEIIDHIAPTVPVVPITNTSKIESSSFYKKIWPKNGFKIREDRMSKSLRDTLSSKVPLSFQNKKQLMLFLYEEMTEYSQ